MSEPLEFSIPLTAEQVAIWERDPQACEAYLAHRVQVRLNEMREADTARLVHALLYGTGSKPPAGLLSLTDVEVSTTHADVA